MQCEIRSIIGKRKEQQDYAEYCVDKKGMFVVVCDGIGSRADGGASARTAVEMYLEIYKKSEFDNFREFIIKATEKVNKTICDEFGKQCGTTVVLVQVSGDNLHWLSIGDSRLYIKRGGKLRQITKDHTYSYVLDTQLDKGLIDKETYEAEKKKGSYLASFLGMGCIDIVDIAIKPFVLEPGDELFLTTDGVYKALDEDDLVGFLSQNGNISEVSDRIINAVEGCGKNDVDNSTFALLRYGSE